jgi:hypothetical protein
MHEFTCCCNQLDCTQLKEFNESFEEVEDDALLAAGMNK